MYITFALMPLSGCDAVASHMCCQNCLCSRSGSPLSLTSWRIELLKMS